MVDCNSLQCAVAWWAVKDDGESLSCQSVAVPGLGGRMFPRSEWFWGSDRVRLAFVKDFCSLSVHVDIRRERSVSDKLTPRCLATVGRGL